MTDTRQGTFSTQGGEQRSFVMLAEVILTVVSVVAIAAAVITVRPDWGNLIFGRLEHISFEGEYRRIDRLELESILAPHLGEKLFGLDLKKLEVQFARLPWIQNVVMKRIWPSTLVVEIKERKAIARWGKRGLVDEDGDVFFPQDIDYFNLPIFITDIRRNREAMDFYYRLANWLQMPTGEVTYLVENSNHSWIATLKRGITLVIGRHDIEKRVKRFARAYANGLGDIAPHIACVDLRYTDGFSVRWKEKGKVSC